jgi:hypothetical protein
MKDRLWSNFFSVLHYSAYSSPESWCSSPRQDPARSTATLPHNPHQWMGRLLVGFCLGTERHLPSLSHKGPTAPLQLDNGCRLPPPPFRLVIAIYRRIVVCLAIPHLLLTHHHRFVVDSLTLHIYGTMCPLRPNAQSQLVHPFLLSNSPLGWSKWIFGIHVILYHSSYYHLISMLLSWNYFYQMI